MENSKNLVRALFVIAATAFMASSATAASNSNDDDVSTIIDAVGCEDAGGTSIPQPAGSTITACCIGASCYICDENGSDCELDPTYKPTGDGKPWHPAAGTLSKPALNGGTVIVLPGTNPTVDPSTKPIDRKSIMQKLIRN